MKNDRAINAMLHKIEVLCIEKISSGNKIVRISVEYADKYSRSHITFESSALYVEYNREYFEPLLHRLHNFCFEQLLNKRDISSITVEYVDNYSSAQTTYDANVFINERKEVSNENTDKRR